MKNSKEIDEIWIYIQAVTLVAYMRVIWEITNVRFPGPACTRIYAISMYFWTYFQAIVFYACLAITDVFNLEKSITLKHFSINMTNYYLFFTKNLMPF